MARDGNQFEILTAPPSFADVTEALEKAGIKTLSAEVSLRAESVYPGFPTRQWQVSILRFVADLE